MDRRSTPALATSSVEGVHEGALAKALRAAFPHFENGEPVTPEAVAKIGRDWLEMVMAPGDTEMEFADHNGKLRKIVFEQGEPDVGIQSGWVSDDTWNAVEAGPEGPCQLVPVEPTRKMWAAAGDAVVKLQADGIGHHDRLSEAVWKAMLGAAQ